jgi:hypothetical protein
MQLGVGGIFAILVLREVFAYLQRRESNKNGGPGSQKWKWKLDKLYDWHNALDDEGVPIWYVRKSLEQGIKTLTASIDTLHTAIREQNSLLDRMVERIESLHSDIRELRVGQIEIEQVIRSIPVNLKPPA